MALVALVAIGVSVLVENYAVVAGILVVYVAWMFIRDWLGRREKYSGCTRIK